MPSTRQPPLRDRDPLEIARWVLVALAIPLLAWSIVGLFTGM